MSKQASTKATATTTAAATTEPKVAKTPKTKTVAPAATPVVATPTPAPATTPAVKKAPAEKKAKAAAAAPTTVVATEPVSAPATTESTETPSEFTEFMTKLHQLSNVVNALKKEFSSLEKKANRERKIVTKANLKKKHKNVNRAPSGFVKPTLISDELSSFLEKPSGTEMARTDVTREINTYIRNNSLQDKTNGRIIIADAKLSALLKIPAGEQLTYFNLQRYMSPHFTKTAPTATA